MVDDLLLALDQLFDDNQTIMALFVVSLCISALSFIVYTIRKGRANVTRRIDNNNAETSTEPANILDRWPGVQSLLGRIADGMSDPRAGERKVLRHRLVQAGFFDHRVAALFIASRLGGVLIFGVGGFIVCSVYWPEDSMSALGMKTLTCAAIGYMAPSFLLDRRISRRREEHRDGFPDLMDLMVVCCQAGLSMEAAINRVSRELSVAYPSLCKNLELATAELRGGLSLGKVIEGLAKRLGIEEASSFSTLLQQSEELGSSLTHSLRAYSDEMRNKRLMKAEEKAHALPAKLVVPLTLFVFPVIMVVIMLPVVIGVTAVWS